MNAPYRTLAARFARIHTIAEAQAMLNRDARRHDAAPHLGRGADAANALPPA